MVINVLELVVKPFAERDHDAQVRIVREGKPRPAPNGAIFDNSDAFRECPAGTDVFNQVKWLTCHEKGQEATVFCWPCLLFPTRAALWNRGITNLTYAFKNLCHHEREAEHLDAVFKLQIFTMQNVGKSRIVIDKLQHNNEVRRNLMLLRRIIEAVCCLVKARAECAERCKSNLLDMNECLEFLNCSSKYKGVVDDFHAIRASPKVLNDLVDAMTMVLRKAVVKEIKKCSYVSVILSEHATGLQSQISTVLRYIKNDYVCERFVGFSDRVEYYPTFSSVSNLVSNILKSYEIGDKFLSLSLDGAVLPRPESNEFVSWLQSRSCKLPFLVPCNFQGFGRVLLDSMLHFEECAQFFETFRELEQFFEIKSNLRALQHVLTAKVSRTQLHEWYAKPPFLLLLCTYRKQFIEYFITRIAVNKIVQASSDGREKDFRDFLEDPKTVFLLKLFHKIFSGFFNDQFNFHSTPSSIKCVSEMICQLNSKIIQTYMAGFHEMWREVAEDVKGKMTLQSIRLRQAMPKCEYFFQKIMNHLIQETNIRATNLLRLSFCDMLTCDDNGRIPFRKSHLYKLISEMGSDYDEVGFSNEIKVVKGAVTPVFVYKSPYTLLKSFFENDLADTFPQFYKLNELVLTLPMLPASRPVVCNTKSSSKFHDIQQFSYVPTASGVQPGDVSVLCVEKYLLGELQRSESFYEDVIEELRRLTPDVILDQV